MPKHHTCWTVTAGTDHNSWWWCSFCSFQFFRYSPAPISIKHLLEHGKTNDNMVSTQRIKSGLWSFFLHFRVLSIFWRRRSPPGLPTWSWSWSCCRRTWWTRESAQRSSVTTSAASSAWKKEVWHNYQLLPSREMVKYEGRQGKEQDLEQFSEAINIIRFHPGWETKKKRCGMWILKIPLV